MLNQLIVKEKNFGIFLGSVFISSLGNSMNLVAIFLYIYSFYQIEAYLSYLFLSFSLPIILLAPFIGHYVDGKDMKKVLITADIVRAALLLCLLVVDNIWMVIGLYALITIFTNAFEAAEWKVIPNLCPESLIHKANANKYLIEKVIRLLAPILAVWIVEWYSVKLVFILDAVTFAGSALLLSQITFKKHEVAPQSRASKEKKKMGLMNRLHDVKEAFVASRHAISHFSLILFIMAVLFILDLFQGASTIVLIPFIDRVLEQPPAFYGYLVSVMSLGSVVGSFLSSTLKKARPFTVWLVGIGLGGLSQIGFGFSFFYSSLWFGFLISIGITIAGIAGRTLFQTYIPEAHLGKIMGVFHSLREGAFLLSVFVGGYISVVMDLRLFFILLGIVMLIAVIIGVPFRIKQR